LLRNANTGGGYHNTNVQLSKLNANKSHKKNDPLTIYNSTETILLKYNTFSFGLTLLTKFYYKKQNLSS